MFPGLYRLPNYSFPVCLFDPFLLLLYTAILTVLTFWVQLTLEILTDLANGPGPLAAGRAAQKDPTDGAPSLLGVARAAVTTTAETAIARP